MFNHPRSNQSNSALLREEKIRNSPFDWSIQIEYKLRSTPNTFSA